MGFRRWVLGAVLVATAFAGGRTPLISSKPGCDLTVDGPIRLVVWHGAEFETKLMIEELTAEFEAANPEVDVELLNVGPDGGVMRNLRSTRPRPDVVLVNQEANINLSDSGLAVPLEDCLEGSDVVRRDELLPASVAANSVSGTLWSLPVFVSVPVLYFDRALFERVGLDPDRSPTDLDELGATLSELVASGEVIDGMVTASPQWFISVWAADLGIEFAPQSGRVPVGPSGFDLDQPALLDRLADLAELAEAGLVRHVDGAGFADLLTLTDPTGAVGMVPQTSGAMKTVYDLLDDGRYPESEVGVFPFPLSSNGTTLGGPSGWLLRSEQETEAAGWSYLEFLASPTSQARIGTLGYVPSNRKALGEPSLQEAWTARPGLRVAADQLWAIDLAAGRVGWAAGPEETVQWRLAWAGRDVLDGRPPIDALLDAETDLGSILESYQLLRRQALAP